MLNVTPSNSQRLARTIQRDYEQAAENRRQLKQCHEINGSGFGIKVGLLVTTLAIAFVAISQFVM